MTLEAFERNRRYKVLLVHTPSSRLELYLYDKVKADMDAMADSIFQVRTKTDLKAVQQLSTVLPLLTIRWVVYCNLTDVEPFMQEFVKLVKDSDTMVFFCKAESYKYYKRFLDALARSQVPEDNISALYLTRLVRKDFEYLYYKIVPRENRLSNKLFQYAAKNYSENVDACLDLMYALKDGRSFSSQKDITELCGVGNSSVEAYLLSLLTLPSNSEKGQKIMTRNRIQSAFELMNTYGPSRLQRMLRRSLKALIEIKTLLINGDIQRQLRSLPEGYDEKELSKYRRYIDKVRGIPMSRLLRLGQHLNATVWYTDGAFLEFFYTYESDLITNETDVLSPEKPVVESKAEKRRKAALRAQEQEKQRYAEALKRREIELIQRYGVLEGQRRFKAEFQRVPTARVSGGSSGGETKGGSALGKAADLVTVEQGEGSDKKGE